MTASPAWSPDGQRIAFIGDQGGSPRVWMISANGGAAPFVKTPTRQVQTTDLSGGPVATLCINNRECETFSGSTKRHTSKSPFFSTDHSVGLVPPDRYSHPTAKNWCLLESTTRHNRPLDYFAGTVFRNVAAVWSHFSVRLVVGRKIRIRSRENHIRHQTEKLSEFKSPPRMRLPP